MEKLTDKQKKVIDYLNNCRKAFLSSTSWEFEKSIGMDEITDQLVNISESGQACYVSFLFESLTEQDKEAIDRELDFYVNYKELYAVYSLV